MELNRDDGMSEQYYGRTDQVLVACNYPRLVWHLALPRDCLTQNARPCKSYFTRLLKGLISLRRILFHLQWPQAYLWIHPRGSSRCMPSRYPARLPCHTACLVASNFSLLSTPRRPGMLGSRKIPALRGPRKGRRARSPARRHSQFPPPTMP